MTHGKRVILFYYNTCKFKHTRYYTKCVFGRATRIIDFDKIDYVDFD